MATAYRMRFIATSRSLTLGVSARLGCEVRSPPLWNHDAVSRISSRRVNRSAAGGIVPIEFDRERATTIKGDLVMYDTMKMLAVIGIYLLLLAGWIAVFLVPILVWRSRVRRRGYPGLRAYLRDLPQTDEEKLDAVELTLKGVVLCIIGLLFPPLVLIGAVPLYYGARKWASTALGIAGAKDAASDELSP
jgi:hypothetical protein